MMIKYIMLFMTFSFLFAQQYAPETFFPAHVGDVWEYSTYDIDYGFERRVIIRDSTAVEGRYIFMSGHAYVPSEKTPAYLIDTSLFVTRNPFSDLTWTRERKYKLDADSADTWIVYADTSFDGDTSFAGDQEKAYVRDTYQSYILGKLTKVMEIDYYAQEIGDTLAVYGTFMETDHIAAGFGFVWRYNDGYNWPTYILNGAVIAGDTLGNVTVGLEREPLTQPAALELCPNFPNPFNPQTTIEFVLDKRTFLELGVFNMRGQKVALLALGAYPPGKYHYTFDGSYLASGTYIYYLKTTTQTLTRKMLLIK